MHGTNGALRGGPLRISGACVPPMAGSVPSMGCRFTPASASQARLPTFPGQFGSPIAQNAHVAGGRCAVRGPRPVGVPSVGGAQQAEAGPKVGDVAPDFTLRGVTPERVVQDYVAATPLGRLETPEDVADVVVFLCSDSARFMTGQGINVTGGVYMT